MSNKKDFANYGTLAPLARKIYCLQRKQDKCVVCSPEWEAINTERRELQDKILKLTSVGFGWDILDAITEGAEMVTCTRHVSVLHYVIGMATAFGIKKMRLAFPADCAEEYLEPLYSAGWFENAATLKIHTNSDCNTICIYNRRQHTSEELHQIAEEHNSTMV